VLARWSASGQTEESISCCLVGVWSRRGQLLGRLRSRISGRLVGMWSRRLGRLFLGWLRGRVRCWLVARHVAWLLGGLRSQISGRLDGMWSQRLGVGLRII
jgi:hypothetical protein